ncbi:MAG: ABC transporter ATP-binding protein [Alphaproteobacteria bacterium]|nr:ABC transporter ATP-binding protein [Alphaproteobacteria bacterium]
MTMTQKPLLEINNLRVEFPIRHGTLVAIDDLSLQIAPGEVLGVVGESGAGKSMTGAAIIGLLEPPGRIAAGEIIFDGQRIDNLTDSEIRKIRGRHIGAIFQDPLTSLNPLHTVGRQITDTIVTHLALTQRQARTRAMELLAEVGIPVVSERIDHYPHQFSGGMRQRVVIALALCAEPKLIIADEPTTALDVSIQAQIIMLLKKLCSQHGAAIMLISHDMGVIAETADRVAVMYCGRIGEIGPVADVIHQSLLPYTVGLMGSIPSITDEVERLTQIDGAMPRLNETPTGCSYHPRCPEAHARCSVERPELTSVGRSQVACWLYDEEGDAPPLQKQTQTLRTKRSDSNGAAPHALVEVKALKQFFDVSPPLLTRLIERSGRRVVKAVNGLDLTINRGETFGLVGESGCGKSTLARTIVGLHDATAGDIIYDGVSLSTRKQRDQNQSHQYKMQMIFQDPLASLNPRWRVSEIVAESIPQSRRNEKGWVAARVDELLRQVGLSPADGAKYPHEFSGGQRQRVSIARALGGEPEFLVCDEPTSALDVSVQAQILNLMVDLQRRLGLTYLFISHDLAVVHHISSKVGVMYLGRVVEWAKTARLFNQPQHPYTRMLLDAVPDISKIGSHRTQVEGEVPSPIDPPSGCSFHPRCPFATDRCRSDIPVEIVTEGAAVACHAIEEGRLPAWGA